ncbi:hypothetical protein TNCV_2401971 [Trichonephila clavipes]|nr:hypothetical protein TNCV_2401971 [Trichonephila clavipes]
MTNIQSLRSTEVDRPVQRGHTWRRREKEEAMKENDSSENNQSGHGATPLSVKENIQYVSSELDNAGYRLQFLDETLRTLLLSAS